MDKAKVKHIAKDVLKRVITIFITVYVILFIVAALFIDKLMFQPPSSSYQATDNIIMLSSADGNKIAAVFLVSPHAKKIILYNHGNAEDLGQNIGFLKHFTKKGIAVFAYDYPGYGCSTGTSSEKNVYQAADAAYAYLIDQLKYKPENIVIYGRSIGSGPAAYLAEKYPVGGLILESAFTSVLRAGLRVKLFPIDYFPNIDRIRKIKMKTLFIHGKKDSVIPFSHGVRLYQLARGEKDFLWVEDAGHDDILEKAPSEYYERVISFIDNL